MKLALLILVHLAGPFLLIQEPVDGAAPANPPADSQPAGGQPAGGPEQAADPAGGLVQMLPLMAAAAILFYLMVLRPQQRQRQERDAKLDALKKNDKVVTIGGIFGTITDFSNDGKRVTLRVDDGTRIKFTRGSIHALYDDIDKPDEESEAKK